MDKKTEIKSKIRRDLFKIIGAGAAGTAIFSFLPFKSLSFVRSANEKKSTVKSKMTVNIHPLAIKRNNKG